MGAKGPSLSLFDNVYLRILYVKRRTYEAHKFRTYNRAIQTSAGPPLLISPGNTPIVDHRYKSFCESLKGTIQQPRAQAVSSISMTSDFIDVCRPCNLIGLTYARCYYT